MVRVILFFGASAAILRLSWRSLRDARVHGFYRFFAFENTTALVTAGVYRLIRHPLYGSLLALVWCAYLKNPPAISGLVLALGASGFLIATAVAEEKENRERFGAAYAAYMKRTWRFIPFVF